LFSCGYMGSARWWDPEWNPFPIKIQFGNLILNEVLLVGWEFGLMTFGIDAFSGMENGVLMSRGISWKLAGILGTEDSRERNILFTKFYGKLMKIPNIFKFPTFF
jgi:hypothetical protein